MADAFAWFPFDVEKWFGSAERLRSATQGSVSCPELAVMTGSALLHFAFITLVASSFRLPRFPSAVSRSMDENGIF